MYLMKNTTGCTIAFYCILVIIIGFCSFTLGHQESQNPQQQLPNKDTKASHPAKMTQRACGGISEAKEPDNTVFEILENIRPDVESKLGQSLADYKPVAFKSQLVNGVNYFIKVDIGNNKFIHVRAYRSFGGDTSLRAIKADKQLLDEIEYFDME